MLRNAKLGLNDGEVFGPGGEGFQRMNLACPRSYVETAMNQLKAAIVRLIMNHHDEEILILELFRKCYADFPKGKLIKSESPDFILNITPKKSIGIEITRLHDGSLSKNNPGFPVAELTKENIETTINHKEEKLTLYQQKKISECWLIIATDYIPLPKVRIFQD